MCIFTSYKRNKKNLIKLLILLSGTLLYAGKLLRSKLFHVNKYGWSITQIRRKNIEQIHYLYITTVPLYACCPSCVPMRSLVNLWMISRELYNAITQSKLPGEMREVSVFFLLSMRHVYKWSFKEDWLCFSNGLVHIYRVLRKYRKEIIQLKQLLNILL